MIQQVMMKLSVCILREMIEVRVGMAKSDIFNIDDVEFIINDFVC